MRHYRKLSRGRPRTCGKSRRNRTSPTHKLAAPRIALMHTWIDTQTEGWWRMALDKLGVPYNYISTQTVAREDNLRGKYDVILFAPMHAPTSQLVLNGVPLWGNPMPWKKTALTPNMTIDQTDDMRPGLGAAGLAHLQRFVEQGGVFLAAGEAAKFAIDMGLAPGVSITPAKDLRVVGSILKATVVDARARSRTAMATRSRCTVRTACRSGSATSRVRRRLADREGFQAPDRTRRSARSGCAGRPRARRSAGAARRRNRGKRLPLNVEQTR